MLKADFHVHTSVSPDAKHSVQGMIWEAIRKGFDIIAITDHNSVAGLEEAKRLTKSKSIFILPGIEVSALEGHILALGVNESVEPLRPAIEVVEDIQEKGGLAIAAHPYHGEGIKDLCYCIDIDGVEVLNARAIGGNGKAQLAAERLNLPGIAGSDAHRKGDLGSVYSLIDSEKNTASILDAIEKKKLVNEGKAGLTAITSTLARKL